MNGEAAAAKRGGEQQSPCSWLCGKRRPGRIPAGHPKGPPFDWRAGTTHHPRARRTRCLRESPRRDEVGKRPLHQDALVVQTTARRYVHDMQHLPSCMPPQKSASCRTQGTPGQLAFLRGDSLFADLRALNPIGTHGPLRGEKPTQGPDMAPGRGAEGDLLRWSLARGGESTQTCSGAVL